MGQIYGYIRVSTREQNEARQLRAMQTIGVSATHIYLDKQSGKDFDRAAYKRLIKTIKKDDLLYIGSIDRLGRDYSDILEQWRFITKTIGADIVVIDMPLLDTRLGKDLMGTFLSDIVLQILSFVAENERDNIRARQAQGIEAAKARGVKFGRPERPLTPAFYQAYHDYKQGKFTQPQAAKQANMPLSTFRYKMKKLENSEKVYISRRGSFS